MPLFDGDGKDNHIKLFLLDDL